jgi:hypothetical protein
MRLEACLNLVENDFTIHQDLPALRYLCILDSLSTNQNDQSNFKNIMNISKTTTTSDGRLAATLMSAQMTDAIKAIFKEVPGARLTAEDSATITLLVQQKTITGMLINLNGCR